MLGDSDNPYLCAGWRWVVSGSKSCFYGTSYITAFVSTDVQSSQQQPTTPAYSASDVSVALMQPLHTDCSALIRVAIELDVYPMINRGDSSRSVSPDGNRTLGISPVSHSCVSYLEFVQCALHHSLAVMHG